MSDRLDDTLERIERDDVDLKQEDFAHDEGRGWRGIYHRATLCSTPGRRCRQANAA